MHSKYKIYNTFIPVIIEWFLQTWWHFNLKWKWRGLYKAINAFSRLPAKRLYNWMGFSACKRAQSSPRRCSIVSIPAAIVKLPCLNLRYDPVRERVHSHEREALQKELVRILADSTKRSRSLVTVKYFQAHSAIFIFGYIPKSIATKPSIQGLFYYCRIGLAGWRVCRR